MRDAWGKCQQRHPYLRSKIHGEQIVPADTASIPVFIDNGNVDELFEKYANEFIPLDREPAPNDLIIIFNGDFMNIMIRMLHSLTDGTSLSVLVNDLLTFYDSAEVGCHGLAS